MLLLLMMTPLLLLATTQAAACACFDDDAAAAAAADGYNPGCCVRVFAVLTVMDLERHMNLGTQVAAGSVYPPPSFQRPPYLLLVAVMLV